MLLVTAYPIGYAIVLSLQHLDLRFPDDNAFAGLSNYETVLTSSLWWEDIFNTLFVTVISVSRSSWCSGWRSRWSCTGRSSAAG